MSLEPIEPQTALDLYLADKANDLAEASLTAHEYRLVHFVRWCDQRDLENLNVTRSLMSRRILGGSGSLR